MKFIRHLTIKRKIAFSIGLLLFITISIGMVALIQIQRLMGTLDTVTVAERAESEAAYELEINTSKIASSVLCYLDGQCPDSIERLQTGRQGFLQALETYRRNRDVEGEEGFETENQIESRLEDAYQTLNTTAKKLIELEGQFIKKTTAVTFINEEIDDILDGKIQAALNTSTSSKELKILQVAQEMEIHLYGIEKNLKNYLDRQAPKDLEHMVDDQSDFRDFLKQYNAFALSREESLHAKQLELLFEENMALIDEVIQLHDEQLVLLNTFLGQCKSFETFLNNTVQANTKVAIAEEHEYAMGLARQTAIFLFLSLVFALILGPASWNILSDMVIKRTKQLLKGTKKILDGDLSVRLPVSGKDELGILSESFNTMTIRLEEAQVNEQRFREELELRVEERTAELKGEIARRELAEKNRHEAELKLRQAEKMETVGQLAGGVAHDFNNFLQVILGHAEMAKTSATEYDTLHDLERISEAIQRARDLTKQLMIFSRRQPMEKDVLDINVLTEDLLKMLSRLIGEHIEIEFMANSKLKPVQGDSGQIQQVLMNLAINARDAMPGGGKLIIQAENIVITQDQISSYDRMKSGHFVRLSITDTGCGMDEHILEHIFEPFFTTKKVGEGTGLGLATVYGIVKSHDGFIQTCSEVGKGTTFKVYLPAAEQQAVAVERLPVEIEAGGTETILLAEDEEGVRLLAERILSSAGYTVLAATDGMEAVEIFKDLPDDIDLVLLDVVMPKLGAKEVHDQIQQLRPNKPTLFCSGYAPDSIEIEFSREMGTELIPKPYTADTLLRKVRDTLQRG